MLLNRVSRTLILSTFTFFLLSGMSSSAWAQAGGGCGQYIKNGTDNGAAQQTDVNVPPVDTPNRDTADQAQQEPMRTANTDEQSATNGDSIQEWAQTGDSDTQSNIQTDNQNKNQMRTNYQQEAQQLGEKAFKPKQPTNGCPASAPPTETEIDT